MVISSSLSLSLFSILDRSAFPHVLRKLLRPGKVELSPAMLVVLLQYFLKYANHSVLYSLFLILSGRAILRNWVWKKLKSSILIFMIAVWSRKKPSIWSLLAKRFNFLFTAGSSFPNRELSTRGSWKICAGMTPPLPCCSHFEILFSSPCKFWFVFSELSLTESILFPASHPF